MSCGQLEGHLFFLLLQEQAAPLGGLVNLLLSAQVCDWIQTAFLLVKRDVFKHLKGYTEDHEVCTYKTHGGCRREGLG